MARRRPHSPSTIRQYEQAVNEHMGYIEARSLRFPLSGDGQAVYFNWLWAGQSWPITLTAMAGIGEYYRDRGHSFDPKASPLREVIQRVRDERFGALHRVRLAKEAAEKRAADAAAKLKGSEPGGAGPQQALPLEAKKP
jgi:hypothetical protein